MDWEELTKNPLLVQNYDLLTKTGILDFSESLKKENKALEHLLNEAYEMFQKESVNELIDYIIFCLSERFIPSTLIFIVNEGVTVSKIKTLTFKNMKNTDSSIRLKSLEPFEDFFRKYKGTSSYLIFENEMKGKNQLEQFRDYNPEIVVPILGLSGLYGMILFGPKILEAEYTTSEISYINRLMKFTSIGIQNNIHYEHSVKDPKTGLYNHNFFVSRVNEEIARSKRNKKLFSVIVMDIDKFKHFNDTYGHLAGDEVIINIAKTLTQTIRDGDILSRFGGEEFTVLLPDTNKEAAWNAAERIRKKIEDMETPWLSHTLKVTISLGISNYIDGIDRREESLFKRADKALYLSKKNGRNKSSFYVTGDL